MEWTPRKWEKEAGLRRHDRTRYETTYKRFMSVQGMQDL